MAEFHVDKSKKIFTIVVAGFTRGSTDFVTKLQEEVAKINTNEYFLILDGEQMKTFKPEILLVLEKAYGLYMSFGFKKIVVLSPKMVTPRLQIKRIAKKCQFTGQFVNGKDEAMKVISDYKSIVAQ